MEVVLKYSTAESADEVVLEGDKLSFGRGSDADLRLDDDGLSRLNSTIYRDGDNIWIVDENSTNGTFVNGEQAGTGGIPLQNGDIIRVGNYTTIKVSFVEKQTSSTSSSNNQTKSATVSVSSEKPRNPATMIAVVAICIAIFLISISVVFIAVKFLIKDEPVISQNNNIDEAPEETPEANTNNNKEEKTTPPNATATPQSGNTANTSSGNNSNNPTPTTSPESTQNNPPINLGGKKYLDLSDAEKNKYIESKLKRIAGIIGNRESDEIPTAAIDRIKSDVNAYARRVNVAKKNTSNCVMGDNLQVTFERASKHTVFIRQAFLSQGIDPIVGVYIAMIESEHCPCLRSPSGPLGMFQFATDAGREFFEPGSNIVSGANPSNPDDRCVPEKAAKGSARYLKYLMNWFGTGPNSVPLAIASYNSGQGAMRKNLLTTLKSDPSLSRDFWSLFANSSKLSEQFQKENFKYPPLFFATAIIGENPQDFGLNLQPLSTYIK